MSNEETPPPPKRATAKTSRLAVVIGVLVLIGLLRLLFPPNIGREQARAAGCRSNLKQIALAVGMYQTDHDVEMPPNFQVLVDDDRIWDVEVFRCPSDPSPPVDAANVDASASYDYRRITDALNLESPERVPIAWEKKRFHDPDHVNVLFADLHVKSLESADLEKRRQLYRDLYD